MPLSNPVSPVSTQNQDFHSRMDENSTNMHLPKGMRLADNGTNVVKYASGDVQYIPINPLPAALDFADSSIAPVTEVDGDIYILGTELSTLTVTDIVWQSGTTVRISFSGSPDLSATTVNDYFIISTASNDSNNGRFILSDVNDGSDYIEISNTSRTDATDDETSISIASTIGFRDWDGAVNNEWVTFNGSVGEWQRIVPSEGLLCYLKDEDIIYTYNGNAWGQVAGGGGYASTDNAIPKADGTGGDLQDSGIICDDSDNLTNVNSIEFQGGSNTTIMSDASSSVEVRLNDAANSIFIFNEGQTTYFFFSDDVFESASTDVTTEFGVIQTLRKVGNYELRGFDSDGSKDFIRIEDNRSGSFTTEDMDTYAGSYNSKNVTANSGALNATANGGDTLTITHSDMDHVAATNEKIDSLSATTGTIDLDSNLISAGAYKTVTATGNITLNMTTIHSTINSVTWYLEFTQDAGGTNTLTLGTNFLTAGGVAPVVSAGSNDTDVLVFRTDSAGKSRLIEHRKSYS